MERDTIGFKVTCPGCGKITKAKQLLQDKSILRVRCVHCGYRTRDFQGESSNK